MESVARAKQAAIDDEKEKIPCLICGKLLHRISPTHLKRHGMTMAEYRQCFPGAPTASAKYGRTLSKAIKGKAGQPKGRTAKTHSYIAKAAKKRSAIMKKTVADGRHPHIQRMREDEEYKRRIIKKKKKSHREAYKTGKIKPWCKGIKPEDDERVMRCAKSRLGKRNSKQHRRKISEARAGKSYEEIYGDRAQEMRDKRRDETIQRLASEAGFCKSNTAPEREMKVILDELKVPYEHQYPVRNRKDKVFAVVDFRLTGTNIIIQVDGDYWHGNPKMFPEPNNSQLKTMASDRRIDKSLKLAGWRVIRIWESELDQKNHLSFSLRKVLLGMII